ncbi:hypothetical protein C8J57DRAFT_1523868 [Mycena rebaudengoi]|nr:hypothetical protein C8J57DRAFT_1523868 [Mycena rebaudengoi]
MAAPTSWVDRRSASRTVPMKVLVLGYFRTGTADTHGIRNKDTHHMQTVLANPPEVVYVDGGHQREILREGQAAITDVPAILFSEALIAAYPEAKIVLTNRDPANWWKSYSSSLQVMYRPKKVRLACWFDPRHLGKVLNFTVIMMIGPVADAKEEFKKRFVAHCEKVQKIVPKEWLLEYEVGEGWGRLCAFLGNDVPKTEFPRVNDAKAILQNSDT